MQYLFIPFKSFVVFCAFDPWHLGLVAFWHGTSGVNHLSRVPFPGQDLTFCLSAHYKTSISTVEGKKTLLGKRQEILSSYLALLNDGAKRNRLPYLK